MSKRWMMVAGALLWLCAAPQAAFAVAQSVVTVALGNQSPTGAFKDLAKSGVMAGLSAGYRVTPWLATGVDFCYLSSLGMHDGSVIDIFEPTTERVVTVTLSERWSITELGLYTRAFIFERGRLAPYLRAGAGAYSIRYSQDVSTASAGTTLGGVEQAGKAGLSAGVGFRYAVVGGTSIGAEVLYHHIFATNTDVSLWTTGFTIGFGPTGN
jgi:hypothetical protein